MNFHTLEHLVSIARSGSPFYRKLYEHVPQSGYRLEDLPIASFQSVMAAVHEDYRALWSSPSVYGMYYTTSGTTGKSKATIFGRDEWQTVNDMLSITHWKNGVIRDGDVIGNLSEAGSASFMAIHGVVSAFPGRCSELPLGCDHPYPHILRTLRWFGANVVAGMSPTLLGLAETLVRSGEQDLRIERLLGGGELFYGVQRELIQDAFPNARYCAFMYGATEAGMIGHSDFSLADNELRVLDRICRLEIVDPVTSEPIRETGRIGKVLITSFVRLAAPAIRLETGDLAKWIDDPAGPSPRFSLHGRLFPFSHDVAGVKVNEDHVWGLLRALERELRLLRFQLVLRGTHEAPSLEAVVSLYEQEISAAALEEAVRGAFATAAAEVASALEQRGVGLRTRRVEFSHFEPLTRRKGRLIADERGRV